MNQTLSLVFFLADLTYTYFYSNQRFIDLISSLKNIHEQLLIQKIVCPLTMPISAQIHNAVE